MISFIVTGFGPFQGVPENPTMILVQSLIEYIEQQEIARVSNDVQSTTNNSTAIPLSQRIRTFIIDTSYRAAQQQMDEIYQEIIAFSSNHSSKENEEIVIILHLGVNSIGQQYQIECCAYNEMQFRIPDMHGHQPQHCPIITTGTYQSVLQTNLYQQSLLHNISNQLNQKRSNHINNSSDSPPSTTPIISNFLLRGTKINFLGNRRRTNDSYYYGTTSKLSTDPGRYVCNYIYYYSMYKFRAGTVAEQPEQIKVSDEFDTVPSDTGTNTVEENAESDTDTVPLPPPRVECLFLHVPPFTIASKLQQLRFVTDLIRLLDKEVEQKQQK